MELGVEHADIGNAGELFFTRFNSGQVRRIVERSEREAFANDVLDLLINQHRFRNLLSAMEHAMSDRRDFGKLLQNPDGRINQLFADLRQSPGMIGNPDSAFALESIGTFVNHVRGIGPHTFHLSACKNLVRSVFHVKQSEFE